MRASFGLRDPLHVKTLAVLLLASAVVTAWSQPSSPKPRLELVLPSGKAVAGSTVDAKIRATFPPSFHAYQNPPSDPSNIPFTIESGGANTKITGIRYPRGTPKPFPGFDQPLGMYEGTIEVPFKLTLPDQPGPFKPSVKVGYQICDDTNCWPPTSETVTGTMSLASGGAVLSQPPPDVRPIDPTRVSGPVSIKSFASAVSSVKSGETVLVSWSSENAVSVQLSDGSQSYDVNPVGTQSLTLTQNTTLTLTARGANGATVQRTLSFAVEQPVQPAEPPAEPPVATTQAGSPPPPDPATKPGAAPLGGDATASAIQSAMVQGLAPYLLLAFLAGIAALATPCVWPMIPITVSFFSKRGEGGKKDVRGALAYSLGIMLTFTLLGLAVSLLFGASGIQRLAANPWVNIGLTMVFVVLALGLFGVFNFTLPQGFVDKFQKGSRTQSGLAGPILMGVAFTLTSFTCTVPFVGTLLVSVATGNVLYPILGMLAFSFAFAVPFYLLALFPQWLASLPKSGSWLASSKAYMGFLELAAALKFMSNVDLAFNWGLLTKPAFLAVWVVVFAMAGFWLVGAMNLPHADGPEPKIGVGRRVFGFLNIGLATYLLTAINGAPLGQMVGFLPPDPYPGRGPSAVASKAGEAPKDGHIAWVKDYDLAVATATAEGKMLFLNFTGDFCVNCRVMENTVFPDPKVTELIGSMVPVWLVTDREDESSRANSALREKLTKSVTNPVYVLQKPDGTVVTIQGGATNGPGPFIQWIEEGVAAAQ
ncbi:MAG: thioredoxin family protein [Fimbriimonadaceae bacterium]|nr:thioredoxin family protein [Fimbriimonadaceae bacterium]